MTKPILSQHLWKEIAEALGITVEQVVRCDIRLEVNELVKMEVYGYVTSEHGERLVKLLKAYNLVRSDDLLKGNQSDDQ